MSWVWRLEDAQGVALSTPAPPTHPNQSDAESWLGENWRQLAEAGVAQATLFEDGREVYGPMALSED